MQRRINARLISSALLFGSYLALLGLHCKDHEKEPISSYHIASDPGIKLSNGMTVPTYRIANMGRTADGTNVFDITISGQDGAMTVYDHGDGKPFYYRDTDIFGIYYPDGSKDTCPQTDKVFDLTYEWCGHIFPDWDPYAFRETREYWEFGEMLTRRRHAILHL